MMMNSNANMKIRLEEEQVPIQIKGDVSQLFRFLRQPNRPSLQPSSMSISREIHDYGCKRKRDQHSIKRKAEEEEVCAISHVVKRVEEVQANLSAKFPTFFKIMIPSVVCRGFLMSLPREFCQHNLPNHDATIILVDESGKEYKINYLAERRALSGGWKKFSIEHDLLVGDALVFHMIKPSKFKVYIVRMNGLAEVDAAFGLLRLHSRAKHRGICK